MPANAIRFRGKPRLVDGLAPRTVEHALTHSVSVDLKMSSAAQENMPLNLQIDSVGISASRLRFSLPESTPPGTYTGMIQLNKDENYPIIVEVEPHPYLAISPRQLSLQLTSDKETTVDLTLVNAGNVPCEITKVYAFGIFDVDGAERSIGAALRDVTNKEQARLGRLLDEAASNHGGLVRVAVREGAGSIEPGEVRDIQVTLRFSDRLKAGHTYWGTWPMVNLKYYVRVHVLDSNPPSAHQEMEDAS